MSIAIQRDAPAAIQWPVQVVTDDRCVEYDVPGHPERRARVVGSLARLRCQQELPIAWLMPTPASDEAILRAHSTELLQRVMAATRRLDPDTPAIPGIGWTVPIFPPRRSG